MLPILENFHIIEAKYIPATERRGSRIRLYSQRFESVKHIGFNHEYNNACDIAHAHLIELGYEVVGKGEMSNGYYLITKTFKTL